MSLNVLILESVGSCVDSEGYIYPLNVDGSPDRDAGVHYSECTGEWYDSLNEEDYLLFIEWHTDNNLSIYKYNKELYNDN